MSRGTAAGGAATGDGAAAGGAAAGEVAGDGAAGAAAGGAAGSTGPWNRIAGSSVSSSMKLGGGDPAADGKGAGRTGTVVPTIKKSRSLGEDLEG